MRMLFIVLGGLVGLIVIAVAAVALLFDPNDYRDRITTAVEDQLGRSFAIDDEIGWSLFPRLAIDLGGIRLGSGGGFGDEPLVTAEGVSAGMAVMPLLSGEIELETLRIDRPVINLIRNEAGDANWAFAGAGGQAETVDAGASGGGALPDWLAGLSLGGIDLSGGRVRYTDATTGDSLTIDPLNLDLGAIALGRTAPISLEAMVKRNGEQWDTRIDGDLVFRRDGSLSLRDTDLRANDLTITELSADIAPTDGGWRVYPLSARFYEGDYGGDIRLGTQSSRMPLAFNEGLNGVAMGPLLTALTGFERLTGTAGINASGDMALSAGDAPLATLNADGDFSIRDGAFQGVNIARLIRAALARVQGETPPPEDENPSTDFTSLTGSVTVRDGIARTDDIAMDSPVLRIRGDGQTDLVEQTLALSLNVDVVGSLQGQGGQPPEELRGVSIPLRIEGNWADPKIRLDIARVIQESQGTQIRERVEEEVDKVRDRLEGLFN
ncbi:AsmA family protein [Spiribacter vilamensis]|uniref:AsmA protein n=1 Tax=Spiribacter vilamensis TaxID=531306 RepID=A0A4V2GJ97_9GAMM|nr:AsmA family protein [Spiribacter vilamensis]RZU99365.1 AsmA protein [Spiribacter vilamensis]